MTDKYQNRYRIASARLQNWDYGRNAVYFVTICTQNREYCFGRIVDEEMILSESGKIAQQFWREIPKHFPFVQLDEYVVLPNHVHGIIIIDKMDSLVVVETPESGVSTRESQTTTDSPKTTNSRTDAASQKWKPASLGAILNQYKRIVSIHARKIQSNFAWQSRFHDHIIRNNNRYQQIKNYIVNNPKNWDSDKFRKQLI